jgi:cell division protein FtsB
MQPACAANWTARDDALQIARMGDPRSSTPSSSIWILPFGLLVFAVVAVPLHILDAEGLPRYRALRGELSRIEASNERLRDEVRALDEDVKRLRSDPSAVERIARDELGMVRKDEVVFQF